MNAKQERFCDEYMIDLNATQAAIRAGYSPKSAGTDGGRLLRNAQIRARIDHLLAERGRRTGVNADRVVRELARVAFLDPTQLIDIDRATVHDDASEDDRAVIASVKVKTMPGEYGDGIEREIKFADKLKALDMLSKHLGMYEKDNRLSVDVIQIIDDIPEVATNG